MTEGAQSSNSERNEEIWSRFPVEHIEDFRNAILGANLDVIRMDALPIGGSLAFNATRGVLFSSVRTIGKVAIRGPVPRNAVSLGVGLRFGHGSRLWLGRAMEGKVVLYPPGTEFDVICAGGTLLVAATLSLERLEAEAARSRLVLTSRDLVRLGPLPGLLPGAELNQLRCLLGNVHGSNDATAAFVGSPGALMLRAVVSHLAKPHKSRGARLQLGKRERVIHAAREFIADNLGAPIDLDALANAADVSPRDLSYAFLEILGDTPGAYIQRMRLHRLRAELLTASATERPISSVAASCGLHEPRKLSGWYREMFGELPGETRRRCRTRRPHRLLH